MAVVDPIKSMVTLLENKWKPSLTDNEKPHITSVTDQKVVNFNLNHDWILIFRSDPLSQDGGLGSLSKNVFNRFKIDVRTSGSRGGSETHWRKIVDEVQRILDDNITNPTSDWDEFTILKPDGDDRDLSDKSINVWRMLMPRELQKLNKTR